VEVCLYLHSAHSSSPFISLLATRALMVQCLGKFRQASHMASAIFHFWCPVPV
jgi:hypothetical protein